MAASAGIEPRQSLLLLKDVRFLYGRYQIFFQPVPPSGKKLAHTLSSLNDGINRLIKYNTGNGPFLAFRQLTLGLSDTLIALQSGLRSYARDYESDMLDASELDSESMERLQTRLHPISMSVEIINEAMETAMIESSGIRSSETIEEICKRMDDAKNSSARLSALVHNFVHGITSQTKLVTPDGRDLHTFTSANVSHGELGRKIAAKLERETREAVGGTKREDEDRSAWMVRHAIYWLSKSSEDLREWRSSVNGYAVVVSLPSSSSSSDDQAWHATTVAKIFLDAIKAAWLLLATDDDEDSLGGGGGGGELAATYGEEHDGFDGFREVLACAKRKVLGLLQSFYGDVFAVPDYDLINEMGHFGMCTDDDDDDEERKVDSFPPAVL